MDDGDISRLPDVSIIQRIEDEFDIDDAKGYRGSFTNPTEEDEQAFFNRMSKNPGQQKSSVQQPENQPLPTKPREREDTVTNLIKDLDEV